MHTSIAPVSTGRKKDLGKLALIAVAAGAFSSVFGVGGGAVIVPLLILFFGFLPRLAAGTSLATIVGIAGLAALGHGLYGNVHLLAGLALALPATVGVVAGTAVQQRLPQRAVSYLFAGLLVVVAIELIV